MLDFYANLARIELRLLQIYLKQGLLPGQMEQNA